ncbi:MAG: phosphoribosyltransferase domain-containing protein [Pseudoflavonifractor sp.]|nr:phosphoribosyltransferase domain-containing protein [Pseudoflavonifractor sp.]
MKVITVTQAEFADMCDRLSELVGTSGPAPDVIIGILRGGGYVADQISRHFPSAKRADVTLRRKSSDAKDSCLVRTLMHYTPQIILNLARIAESYCTRYRPLQERDSEMELSEDIADFLSYAPRHILVVDDAIDSGATMLTVVSYLRRLYPHCVISTAAITVTTPKPAIKADFCIYNNDTLIRFPWAADSRHPMP